MQAEDHADADLFVGLHDRIEMPAFERIEGQHVLDRGHAGAQAFERAEQSARAYLFHRAGRILRRQRVETPGFERHFLQRAFGQHVVRMVMRIDEAGQHEMPARIELFDRGVRDRGKAGRDAGDLVSGNRDVERIRLVPVGERQHCPAATDDQRGPGWNRLKGHGSDETYLSGMRSSRGGRKRSS